MKLPAIAGLVLCAGASRRMGTPKALLPVQGELLINRTIRILAGSCRPVVVVLGHEAEAIRERVTEGVGVVFAVNPSPERGMLSSLQCGLRALEEHADAVVFTPVDYPRIQASTVEKLVEAFAAQRAPVTIPVFEGRRGHPVCVARGVMEELLALAPDADARDVLRRHRPQSCMAPVSDAGILCDLDVPEDYAQLVAAQ